MAVFSPGFLEFLYIYTGAGHIISIIIKKLIYFTNSIQKVKLV